MSILTKIPIIILNPKEREFHVILQLAYSNSHDYLLRIRSIKIVLISELIKWSCVVCGSLKTTVNKKYRQNKSYYKFYARGL